MKRILLAGLLFAITACSGDSSGPKTPNIEGTWTLVTVNSLSLPWAYSDQNGIHADLVAEIMTISGTSFQRAGTYRFTSASGVTEQSSTVSGTYRYENRGILHYSDGSEWWCVLDGESKLLVHVGTYTLEYHRQ